MDLEVVGRKYGAGSGHLQAHRESQPEREDNIEPPEVEREFFQPYSRHLIVILEGRISPSYFVSSRS